MTHEIGVDAELNALVVTTSGEATIAGFKAFIAEVLTHSKWTPGMNVICDHSRLDTRTLSSTDIQQLAEIHVANDRRIGPGFHAIATGQPATFGLARMWEAYTDGRLVLHTRVCYTFEEACAWLREVTGKPADQVSARQPSERRRHFERDGV